MYYQINLFQQLELFIPELYTHPDVDFKHITLRALPDFIQISDIEII